MIRPSSFAQAEAKSHSQIQDEFSTQWRFYPSTRKPNYSPVPDPTRAVQVIRATFFWLDKNQRLGLKESAVVSRTPHLSIHRDEMIGVPRLADVFMRCCDGVSFEVTLVSRDGLTGLLVELVQLGTQG